MVTEGNRINPVAILVHVLGIALGLYLGWIVMAKLSPDQPSPSVEPGVSSSTAPDAVSGDDPDSLFRAQNFGPALAQVEDQMAAGEGIVSIHLEPGTIETQSRSGDGLFEPADVSADTPTLLVSEINVQRDGSQIDLGSVLFMDLVATEKGPRWYVQLDINEDIGPPPWTYGAPLEGLPVRPGGPPKPVSP